MPTESVRSGPVRNGWKLVAALLAVIGAVEIYFAYQEDKRVLELRDLIAQAYSVSVALEEQIGYGGLIHNFKNYVLRHGETHYRDSAVRNAETARALIDQFETLAASFGVELKMDHTREMTREYQRRLDVITQMVDAGAAPSEIDVVVRYSDEPALREIRESAQTMIAVVNERIARVQNASQLRLHVIFVLISFGVAYFCFTVMSLMQQAQTVRAANADLNLANAALTRSNLALKQFAGIASHDLRSPIRNVALLADLLEKESGNPQKAAAYARDIRGVADRMSLLVSSLLDFTKHGLRAPQKRTVDPSAILSDIRADLAPDFDRLGARLIVAALPKVSGDQELLRRVFHNLIENSLRYKRDGVAPEITVSGGADSATATLSISDNGIGIDPVHAEKIFEPMQRLHGRNSDFPGVGIGLYLVRSIVEAHGGKVWLDKTYSPGARICFTLGAAD